MRHEAGFWIRSPGRPAREHCPEPPIPAEFAVFRRHSVGQAAAEKHQAACAIDNCLVNHETFLRKGRKSQRLSGVYDAAPQNLERHPDGFFPFRHLEHSPGVIAHHADVLVGKSRMPAGRITDWINVGSNDVSGRIILAKT